MVLTPEIVELAAGRPVLAAGGIASGRQMAAALALGAAGVWCGSVWLSSDEDVANRPSRTSSWPPTSSDTLRSPTRTGKPARQLRSAWHDEWERPRQPRRRCPCRLQPLLVNQAWQRIDAAAEAGHEGALRLESFFIGQVVGSLREVTARRRDHPADRRRLRTAHRRTGRTAMTTDPRTPVIVGVGQASERLDDPGYRRRSPVDLAADAARAALEDALGDGQGTDTAALAAAIDTVAGVRQFEVSTPGARAPLGRSDNYPRSVAGRIGASPARAVLEVTGGQAPQHLVNEFAATIAAGRAEVVLLFGSEAISTIEHLAKTAQGPDRPDFTEHAGGSLEDRGYGLRGIWSRHTCRPRARRRPGPVRADRQRPPGPAQAEPGRVRRRHGRPVRAVHPGGGGQPARRRAGRAQRRRAGHPDRRRTGRSPTRTPGSSSPGRRSTRAPPCC